MAGRSKPGRSKAVRARASAREALLEAAVAEFADKGYEAATLAGIARRAGVTTGAVYAHFRSKLELLLEAVGLHTVETYGRRAAALGNEPAPTVAHALARGLVGAPRGRRDLLLIDALVLARRDPSVAATYRRLLETHVEAFERTARLGVESGRIDPILPHDELARLVLAVSFGVMVLRALGEAPPSETTVAGLVEQLVQPARGRAAPRERGLARVQSRSRGLERAEADLHEAIVQAAAEGHSLRRIGDAAGLSHERIRRIVSEGAPAPAPDASSTKMTKASNRPKI
ncbi:MAG TPA: helix-turn-helix domain-containing protein [Myxococcota bacterium]|jgi:AcrR family transcriptional regulator|nr:helix-turn-helix domain-containing protein [Myxococcota bacterium]